MIKPKEEVNLSQEQLKHLVFLKEQKDFSNLEIACKDLLLSFPHNTKINNYMGIALAELGRFEEAIYAFETSLLEAKNKSKTYNNIGITFLKMENYHKALVNFEKSLVENSNYIEGHFNKGNALRRLGRVDEAIKSYEETLLLDPEHMNARLNISISQKQLGNFEESKDLCSELLALRPNWGSMHRHLSSMKKYKKSDPHISQMISLLSKESLEGKDKSDICFALGKAYEDIGEFAKAFSFIEKGNSLHRTQFDYSSEKTKEYFSLMKESFKKDQFKNLNKDDNYGDNIIFVLGLPRSGTSLVEQILASHSCVYGAGELRYFRDSVIKSFYPVRGRSFPRNLKDHKASTFNKVAQHYLENVSKLKHQGKIIVDKMPYNFMYIGMIALVFPGAKIVLVERNAMDNCFSIFKQRFGTGNLFSYSLREVGEYYNMYNDLMSHWLSLLRENIYSIRYEEIVEDLVKQSKGLLDYCDLEWEEACLNFHRTERDVRTASAVQVRQPIYSSSIEIWKKYEKELNPLVKIINERKT